ncbi:MAG: hypothetical protein IKB34_05685 [Clostridia bacterium]|nr:hypothetical protein [Clostridia bacterium]
MDVAENIRAEGAIRRYRAAIYAVCDGVSEVDRAFDMLVSLMLSERRESYLWGVMLDHAPASLFRTFGDREIEDRVRMRFDELRSSYPECGFFCFLRGRRYGKDRVFRCENGLPGALRMLAGGRDEGFSLRLSTGDRVEHSDRMFVCGTESIAVLRMLPGTVTSSGALGDAVSVTVGHSPAMAARWAYRGQVYGDFSRNCRVCGWLPLVSPLSAKAEIYRIYLGNSRRAPAKRSRSVGRVNDRIAEQCAAEAFLKCFTAESLRGRTERGTLLCKEVKQYTAEGETMADVTSWKLIGGISLYCLGRIDAVNLEKIMTECISALESACPEERSENPGFVRIALLIGASFADGMEIYDSEFCRISVKLGEMAEYIRREYEFGRRVLRSPFSPSEMLAFRCEDTLMREVFRGFAALRRLSDCFLYLLSDSDERKIRLRRLLVCRGFGKTGLSAADGTFFSGNALLLALCAEFEGKTFSRMAGSVPEITACRCVIGMLPEPTDALMLRGLDYKELTF